jgi:hypothetical protein
MQGHSKIVHRCNTSSGAQTSEDSSELAARQSCTGDIEPRGKGSLKSFRDLETCNLVTATIV